MSCVERHDPLKLYPKSESSYSKRSKLKLHVSRPGWPEKKTCPKQPRRGKDNKFGAGKAQLTSLAA